VMLAAASGASRTSRRDQYNQAMTAAMGGGGGIPPDTAAGMMAAAASCSSVGTGMAQSSAASSSNSLASGGSVSNMSQSGSQNQQTAWRSKLGAIKNSFLGTPRFHRRKFSGQHSTDRGNGGGRDASMESSDNIEMESMLLDTNEYVVLEQW